MTINKPIPNDNKYVWTKSSSSRAFLFQYRSIDIDWMVTIEASSLNDALIQFATYYAMIEEVYRISEVF